VRRRFDRARLWIACGLVMRHEHAFVGHFGPSKVGVLVIARQASWIPAFYEF
jgi:hypothetical protein